MDTLVSIVIGPNDAAMSSAPSTIAVAAWATRARIVDSRTPAAKAPRMSAVAAQRWCATTDRSTDRTVLGATAGGAGLESTTGNCTRVTTSRGQVRASDPGGRR